jgi:hypothetical protein
VVAPEDFSIAVEFLWQQYRMQHLFFVQLFVTGRKQSAY